jgi:predicted HTH domain antitoxin
MPRKAAKNPSNNEGRLQLAVNALKKDQITSVREAARLYNVPRSTLQARYKDRLQRSYKRAHNTKLSETKEITLREWIISMDKRGCPVRPSMVELMANCLLAKRDSINLTPTVGKN